MKSRIFKTCSWVLVLVMLINLLPIQAIALETQSTQETLTEDAVVQAPGNTDVVLEEEQSLEDATILMEIVENRTEFTKEYKLSNGMHMAIVYPEAVHFEEDGQWEDIDNTLKTKGSGESATYATTAGAWSAEFPQNLRDGAQVSITKDGYTVSFGMAGEMRLSTAIGNETATYSMRDNQGATHTMTISDARESRGQVHNFDYSEEKAQAKHPEIIRDKLKSRMSYPDVYSNTDIVYDVNSYQVKESIVINEYDATVYGYLYTLNTGTLVPVLNADGSIDLFAPNSTEVVMTMPAPFMVDNAGAVSNDVTVALEQKGNVWLLAYQMPMNWLADEDRAWPVVLDPVVVASSYIKNIMDQTVTSTGTIDYKSGALLCGYTTGASYGKLRTYIQYVNLPALSSADVIVNATLSLYAFGGSSDTTTIEAHAVTDTWESQSITWANQPGYSETVEDYAQVSIGDRFSWDITDIARSWYATENTGVMLKVPEANESTTTINWKKFYSSDYSESEAAAGIIPYLMIVFRNSNGLESYWDYTTTSAGRAGTGYVNNYTGNLTWVRSDLGFGGNRMPVAISHIYNTNDASASNFGLGAGWKTNYHQTVAAVSLVDDDDNVLATNGAYVWIDGDGTAHYFVEDDDGTLVDEDGLELTLTVSSSGYVITDKYGNTSSFDSNGRLTAMTNNQKTKSSISITYTTTTGKLISQITDGIGRKYNFTYTNGLLSKITYTGSGSTEITSVTCTYDSNSRLTSITDKDGSGSTFTYDSSSMLSSVTDVDGYKIVYTYSSGSPARVVGIAEYDGATTGSSLSIEYAHNQTTFMDHNGHVQITQFNDWGNVVSVQNDQGRAQFAQYAMNKYDDTSGKGNQLTLSSKMQNTVVNLLTDSSFENGTVWNAVSEAVGTCAVTTTDAYLGSKSLLITSTASNETICSYGAAVTVPAEGTCSFSAYVKAGSASVRLGLGTASEIYAASEMLSAGSDWVRLEVSYTNISSAPISIYPLVITASAGTVYLDCVQAELEATASRYNLLDNGDFSTTGFWNSNYGRTTATNTVPELSSSVYRITGNPSWAMYIYQTVNVSGSAGDTFVLAGWAKGDAAPLRDNRSFCLRLVFNNTDGTTTTQTVSFNTECDSQNNWQYAAAPAVAEKAYSSVTVYLRYDYNVNTVYFDGIQLFKEEFGSSYTYDEDGNVTSVVDLQKQQTIYDYDDNGNLELVKQVIGDTTVTKMTYEYDDYHNVIKATTATGVVYEFTYDNFGNNTSVSIVDGDTKITSTATYSTNGNILLSTTDALAKVTQYGYNVDTNVLEWVQYPEDTESTRTEYSYDTMYRLASATADVDSGYSLDASYTYAEDLLTSLATNSTTYNFTYGEFAQISSISVGTKILASYTYTDTADRYLQQLTYGNGDYVQYTYDDYGRVVRETCEDGDTVTYTYDNSGALATVTDSATGITTTYYYDFTDRLMKYVESGTNYSHSVGYEFDSLNNLTAMREIVNGVAHKTTYAYNQDNQILSVTIGTLSRSYSYDAFGRTKVLTTRKGDADILSQVIFYRKPISTITNKQPGAIKYVYGENSLIHTYTYDDNGNITSVTDGTYLTSYTYDSSNQLLRENNQRAGLTWVWNYDNAGNILTKTEYAYTTGELETPLDTLVYAYEDSSWGDLLTGYDGTLITYDGVGNPVNDGRWSYTWEHGRELASMTDGTNTWIYTYDSNGMRTGRTNGTTQYTYIYNCSLLTQLEIGEDTLFFVYDASSCPMAVVWNGITYYYFTNMQGDVEAILNSSGEIVVSYSYDAWGRVLGVTGTMATTLGLLNPLMYRGYVYDYETGLYYLQSRYYNPTWGRFINADSFVSTGQGLLGNNMFAYCLNNPTTLVDANGESATVAAAGTTVVGIANIWNPIGWVVVGTVVVGTTVAIGYKVYQRNAHRDKTLADVKVKKQSDKKKLYQLAYISKLGLLIKVGKKMTFTEALTALGVSGAVNSISKKYKYDAGKASSAQQQLQHLGIGEWGIYANSQYAAKALAYVFGCVNPPEVHGWGMYGHYHDGNHIFHIWFGGVLYY